MAIRRMMSEADKKKFEEEIIKKYKAEHKVEGKRIFTNEFLSKIKALSLIETLASAFIIL